MSRIVLANEYAKSHTINCYMQMGTNTEPTKPNREKTPKKDISKIASEI